MKIKNLLHSMFLTIVFFLLSEIFFTSVIPSLGFSNFSPSINILFIIFLGIKFSSAPYLPVMILFLQVFHSSFTVGGWELGTIAGIICCYIISLLKDLIHFNSFLPTIVVVFLLQVVWFILETCLLYFRFGDGFFISQRISDFIPESIFLALAAPFVFKILSLIWGKEEEGIGANV
jgi:hypothetical protein